MVKKKKEIADAVRLDELQRQSGVLNPPIEVMLERFGLADQIGVNDYGAAAVPVEVATEFLGAYEQGKGSQGRQRYEYQNFLKERRVAIARAEIEAQQEAEIRRQANSVVDDDAPTFEDWQADHGDV